MTERESLFPSWRQASYVALVVVLWIVYIPLGLIFGYGLDEDA